MKACKICGLDKPYDRSQKQDSKASGFMGKVCWGCHLAAVTKLRCTPEGRAKHNAALTKAYAKAVTTPEGRAKHNAASTKANTKLRATPEGRAKCNAASAKLRATPEGRAQAIAAGLAWAKKYPAKAAALATKRKAAKLQRIPSWANLDAIKQVYTEAAKQGLEVDHIYPLQGVSVSGLHVENNLQLLTKSENSSKGNRMPKEA